MAFSYPAIAISSRLVAFDSRPKIVCARSSEFSDAKIAPERPSSKSLLNAGRSLATIGVLAAIASARIIPKDSLPVLGAIYKEIDLKNCAFSISEILPRKVIRSRSSGGTNLSKSLGFPGPATKILKFGTSRTIFGMAARRTARPLRGSSNLPINPRVLGSAHSERTPIPSNLLVSIPFGITTASVLNLSFRVSLAISLTAIFAVILSISGSSIVPIAFATFCGFAAA